MEEEEGYVERNTYSLFSNRPFFQKKERDGLGELRAGGFFLLSTPRLRRRRSGTTFRVKKGNKKVGRKGIKTNLPYKTWSFFTYTS